MKAYLRYVVLIVVFCLLASFVSLRAHASIVYTQNPTYPGLFNAWTSSTATGVSANQGWSTYDDFVLSSPANIQKLIWQGFYLGNSSNLPNTDNWALTIYASRTLSGVSVPDFSNREASVLVPGSDVARASQGFGTLSNGAEVLVYDFQVILDGFFSAAAHTRYWLLIESFSATNDPVWAWMSGNRGNGTSLQQQEGSSSFFQRSSDRAFALYNDTNLVVTGPNSHDDPIPIGGLNLEGSGFASVPEPSSWIIFGILGVAVSLVRIVRFRRR
ncbi:MAG: PEP-CTERM sorting domain-containing protein [Pirellulaceae bacterium]